MSDAEIKDSTHVIIDGVRYDYVKKIMARIGTIPALSDKATPYMRLSGTLDEGNIEAGDESDFTRWTGIITCQTLYAGNAPAYFVSRGLVFRELDQLFEPLFHKDNRRLRGGGTGEEYYALPSFQQVHFGIDVAVVKADNRRGFNFGFSPWHKPAVSFSAAHVFKDTRKDMFKPFDKAAAA